MIFNRNVASNWHHEVPAEDHVPVDPRSIASQGVERCVSDDFVAKIVLKDGTIHRRRFARPSEAQIAASGKTAEMLAGAWLDLWISAIPPEPPPDTGA